MHHGIEVHPHGVGCSIRISLHEGIENGLVFLQGDFLTPPRVQQPAHAVQSETRCFRHRLYALKAQGIKQHGMEFHVKTVKARCIIVFSRRRLIPEALLEIFNLHCILYRMILEIF